MTASFVSPGWVNFNVNVVEDRFLPDPLDNDGKVALCVHMTAGVWFYTICVYKFKRGSNGYYDVYQEKEKQCTTRANSYDFEQRLYDVRFGRLNRNLMLEIQIISSIGIVFALLGFIGTIVNTRRVGECRWAGLLTCISLLTSGGTYIAAMIKTAVATPNAQSVFYDGWFFEDVQFYCPWGLVLGITGCLFTLVSAIGPMVVLIKNKTHNDVNDYQTFKNTNQGILQQYSYPIIAPLGYHETFGLKVPLVDEKREENILGPGTLSK